MDSSSDDEVEVLEVRKAPASSSVEASAPERKGGGGGAPQASKRRRKPAGPPPRLAWGGSAIGGVGGSSGTFSRRSSADSHGSAGDVVTTTTKKKKKKDAPPVDDDDDGLWDDDDDLAIPTRDAFMTSAGSSSTSKSRAKAKASKGGTTTKKKAKKGSDTSASASASASSPTDAASMMWVDKHAPQTSADLCVAPKKVKEIREWMVQASTNGSVNRDPFSTVGGGDGMGGLGMQLPGEPVPPIFILVGSPGVGKSTTVRVLASELGWTVHQWNDAQQDTPSGVRSGGNGYGRSTFDSAMSVRYQSQMTSFEEFLAAAGTGYTALDFGGGASGSSGGGMSMSLPVSKAGKKRKASSKATIDNDRAAPSNGGGAIILIEDIPNLYSPEAEATFRTIMTHHIHKSQTPTVLIFSDVSEGKHRPSDLERLIDPSILYSPLARIFQINGVAKPKMKKCLQAIVKQERLRGTSDLLYEELHATSKGDIRHAIMALQFQYASAGSGSGSGRAKSGKSEYSDRERDTKLSMFRALGKLLYAKRQKLGTNDEEYIRKISSWNNILPGHLYDSRPPLEFVPEKVMNTGDIDHKNAVSFLQYHCPEFFTDEMELSTAFNHFSDAALFLDREYSVSRDRSDSVFPLEYVSSIAGRAVANANKNPAPNRFRQLSTPKVNDVLRKKRGNDISMLQLCQRLSCGSDCLSLGANIGSTNHFVVDTLPYIRTIVPGGKFGLLTYLFVRICECCFRFCSLIIRPFFFLTFFALNRG